MELPMHASQVFTIDVRVDLGRRDIYVSEHLLNGPEIRTTLE